MPHADGVTLSSQSHSRSNQGIFGIRFRSRVNRKQLAVYSRQLSTLLTAGVPIVQSLRLLLRQEEKGFIRSIIKRQILEIESGSSFSSTLAGFPTVFDGMFVSLVVAGEKAGVLDQVMARLAFYLERKVQTSGKIRSAMTYPLVVLFASILIVSGLLIFVVPQFEEIFQSMLQGAPLPVMTRMVMRLSEFVQRFWYLVPVLVLLCYLGVVFSSRIEHVRRLFDKVKLSFPVFGELLQKSILARFCRTLGTLLESAVPILDAIDTSRFTMNNLVLEYVIFMARKRVCNGLSVAESLATESAIPPVLIGMIEVGEATGGLSSMLLQIAETYEQEVEVGVSSLTTLIEPVMILMLAGIIGFLVIALFLPIVEIMQYLGT